MLRNHQSWSSDSSSAFLDTNPSGTSLEEGRNTKNSSSLPKKNRGSGGGVQKQQQQKPPPAPDFIERFRDEYEAKYGEGPYHKYGDNNGNIPKTETELTSDEIYIVRQDHAYFAIGFSLIQTVILALMMWQCGIAPVEINPMVGPYPDALSEWGGKNATLIFDGQWWRLLTPILLHAGLLHLLGNIAVQLEAGAFFEREWGSLRWLIIYLGSAVASSALSVITMPEAVSVGSSGAVMGIFGGKLAEVLLRCAERTDTAEQRVGATVRREQCVTVTCSVVVVMAFSFIPYVDWAAHLGGLIGGIAAGTMIFACDLEYVVCKGFWVLAGLAMSVATYAGLLFYMYESGNVDAPEELRDVCGYYKKQFDNYECRCMKDEYLNNNNNNGK